jgi:hypothetical protein
MNFVMDIFSSSSVPPTSARAVNFVAGGPVSIGIITNHRIESSFKRFVSESEEVDGHNTYAVLKFQPNVTTGAIFSDPNSDMGKGVLTLAKDKAYEEYGEHGDDLHLTTCFSFLHLQKTATELCPNN